MRILLTNDDGIDAPGLAALRQVCEKLGHETLTVAPAAEMSQVGHRVTTKEAIYVREVAEGVHAVQGTPADCVRLALHSLFEERPGVVISGINFGGNMGQDIPISGTVAAAREAAYHGTPAIAVSNYHRKEAPFSWDAAIARAFQVLGELLDDLPEPGSFWNVNFPHRNDNDPEPRVIHCEPDRHPLPVEYRIVDGGKGYFYAGNYSQRRRAEGSDVDVCFSGNIAVSKLHI